MVNCAEVSGPRTVGAGVLTLSAIIRSTSGGNEIMLSPMCSFGFKPSLAVDGVVASERAIAHEEATSCTVDYKLRVPFQKAGTTCHFKQEVFIH